MANERTDRDNHIPVSVWLSSNSDVHRIIAVWQSSANFIKLIASVDHSDLRLSTITTGWIHYLRSLAFGWDFVSAGRQVISSGCAGVWENWISSQSPNGSSGGHRWMSASVKNSRTDARTTCWDRRGSATLDRAGTGCFRRSFIRSVAAIPPANNGYHRGNLVLPRPREAALMRGEYSSQCGFASGADYTGAD